METTIERHAQDVGAFIVNRTLPMRDAVALYRALDDTSFCDGTDTYLHVILNDGTSWDVVEVTVNHPRLTPGSPLALRGVHTEYILTLDPNPFDGWYDGTTIHGRDVTIRTDRTLRAYNDDILFAVIREY